MSDTVNITNDVDAILQSRYSKLSIIFLLLSILFIVWILVVYLGAFIFEMEATWAGLSLEYWIYVGIVLIVFFMIMELVFYFHFRLNTSAVLVEFKPKPEFYQGKRLYVFTHPTESEGGFYSKTYIQIDENSVLRLRTLIASPENLLAKKEE